MSVFLGIIIAIIAYSMYNIGMALQKKAASSLPNIENTSLKGNLKNFLSNKIWLLGFIMATVQWYIYLIALPMAPLSVLSSMMGVGLVVLVVFSYFYLKEKITKIEIIGVIVIIVGVVILGVTTINSPPEPDLPTINVFMAKPSSMIYVGLLLLVVFTLIAYCRKMNYKHADIMFGLAAGLLGGIGTIFSKAFTSGFTAPNLLDTIKTWQWYIYILLLIVGNMGMAPVQQVGFQKGKAVIVAPLTSIGTLIFSIIGGVLIYEEWAGLPQNLITWKIIALIIVVIGVIILSFLKPAVPPTEQRTNVPQTP